MTLPTTVINEFIPLAQTLEGTPYYCKDHEEFILTANNKDTILAFFSDTYLSQNLTVTSPVITTIYSQSDNLLIILTKTQLYIYKYNNYNTPDSSKRLTFLSVFSIDVLHKPLNTTEKPQFTSCVYFNRKFLIVANNNVYMYEFPNPTDSTSLTFLGESKFTVLPTSSYRKFLFMFDSWELQDAPRIKDPHKYINPKYQFPTCYLLFSDGARIVIPPDLNTTTDYVYSNRSFLGGCHLPSNTELLFQQIEGPSSQARLYDIDLEQNKRLNPYDYNTVPLVHSKSLTIKCSSPDQCIYSDNSNHYIFDSKTTQVNLLPIPRETPLISYLPTYNRYIYASLNNRNTYSFNTLPLKYSPKSYSYNTPLLTIDL